MIGPSFADLVLIDFGLRKLVITSQEIKEGNLEDNDNEMENHQID